MDSGETEGFGDWKLTGILVPPLCLGERAGAAWGSLSLGTSRQPFPFLWVAQEGTRESSQECVASAARRSGFEPGLPPPDCRAPGQ